MVAGAEQSAVHDDVRHAHTALRHAHALVCGAARRHCLGLLELLCHNHRRGPHLEIPGPHLHTAHHRRHAAVLPRALRGRRGHARPLRHAAARRQPSADELLFRLRDGGAGHRRPGAGVAPWRTAPLVRRHSRSDRCGSAGCGSQRSEPLQHLRILQGNQAHAERTDAAPHRGRRPRRSASYGRSALRADSGLELRRRRELLAACARHQGRCHGP